MKDSEGMRYKAERDIARQQVERLQAKLNEMTNSLINAEYDADEHEWVREHGGLDKVREYPKMLDIVNSTINDGDVGVHPFENGDLDTFPLMMDELRKRLMPPGYEWPRFYDGKQVECGSEFMDGLVNVRCATSIEIMHSEDDEEDIVNDALIHWNEDDTLDAMLVCMWQGERVKLPKQVPTGADGLPIKIGDTVYHFRSGEKFNVISGASNIGVYIGKNGKTTGYCRADYLTHTKPVVGADGLPIKVGDEVWDAITYKGPFSVKEVELDDDRENPEDIVWCGEYLDGCYRIYRAASELTHAKPEPVD